MRRVAIAFAVLLLVSGLLPAQTTGQFEARTEHYRVVSDVSQAHAEETANRLEATLEIFNEYFHFELSELPSRMKVRIFAEKADFDSYLRRIIDETREDFIYLHYGDLARNELIGYRRDGPEYDYSLNHQAFIQYLRSFIDNPPLWIREGFAVYFEDVQYDPETGQATYRENLAWLNTLKQIVEGSYGSPPIPLNRMLDIDVETARERIDVFYPQAWGMVSFLLNTENRDINRIMWDAINALDPGLGMTENARAVEREAVRWVEEDALVSSFTDYLTARRSFRDLVEDGMQRYEDGEIEVAEEAFVKALTLRDDSYVPYYYLGLINYDRANFGMADYYYREALDRGATEALTYYALGVNAYADNRFDEARTYLEQTIELDPDGYAEQAEQLIARMED